MFDWSSDDNKDNTSQQMDTIECHPELMTKNQLIERLKEVSIEKLNFNN